MAIAEARAGTVGRGPLQYATGVRAREINSRYTRGVMSSRFVVEPDFRLWWIGAGT